MKLLNENTFTNLTENLIIVQQNIRSLRKNFVLFILKFQSLIKKPQIVILTEIWIEDHEVPQYNIPHYNTFASCNNNYRAGGVIIYLREELTGYQVETIGMRSADTLWLRVKLNIDKPFCISVLAVYRLQEFSIDSFIEEFDSLLNKIDNLTLIVSGDLNIDLLKKNSQVDNYLIKTSSHGLFPLIEQPTRVTTETSTCIDHILFRRNINDRITYDSGVINSDIGDHRMTYINLKHLMNPTNHVKETVSKVDINTFKEKVSNTNWSGVYSVKDPSEGFFILINTLQKLLVESKKTVCKISKTKLKPWMNKGLLKMVRAKNAMYKKTLKQPQNANLRNSYTVFKNKIQNEIRKTKDSYYKQKFNTNHKNPKEQWRTINEITGNKEKATKKIILRDYNETIIQDQKEVANIFNTFFSTIADELKNGIDKEISESKNLNNDIKNYFPENTYSAHSIFFYPTTITEIRSIVNTLGDRKAPGFDGITPVLVKNILESIEKVLMYLINFSLSRGIFPDILKKAVLKPLYKKNEKTNPSNYRPIALLSIFSKILEKVVKIRLVNFLENRNYFSKNQFGFRSKMNTSNALSHFMTQVYQETNKGKCCAGIFIDIMKAFDTVDHQILLTKLHDAGIRGTPLEWFRSYLLNRNHVTRVGSIESNMGTTRHGIPQGSVLSGPLFLIYVNSLCEGVFKGKLTAFADDTALFYSGDSLAQLRTFMQEDLDALRLWFTKNYMVLSPKTKYVIFSLSHNIKFSNDIRYHEINCTKTDECDCLKIEQVANIKYLGLNIDSKLTWKVHIDYLKNKLLKYIRTLYMLRSVCKRELLKSIYYALISSKMEYGIEIYGGAYLTTIKPIITLQKCFIRIITNRPKRYHTENLFKELKVLPFRNLYIYKVLKVFFNRSGESRQSLGTRTLSLRRHLDVPIPKPKSTAFKKCFLYLAPKLYNAMPENIKQCHNERTFSYLLKNHLSQYNNVEMYFNPSV